jgi:hypothetical protein
MVVAFSKAVTGVTTSGFSISGSPTISGFSSISGSGTTWTFTLNGIASLGDMITISYDAGTGSITDLSGNPLPGFTNQPVTNNVSITDAVYLYVGAATAPANIGGSYDFATAFAWLDSNAVNNGAYTIELLENTNSAPRTLEFTNKNITITLKGKDATRILQLTSPGSLFTVGASSGNYTTTLILEDNITLQGRSNNNVALVYVNLKGTFIMNGGRISGNTSGNNYNAGNGGGVYNVGTFTMNGGEISGNTASYGWGGGGMINEGTFTMNGGKISDNTAYSSGGVLILGTFIMNGGEISGNTASANGGGVVLAGTSSMSGTFTMSGGKISGNSDVLSGGVANTRGIFSNGSLFMDGDAVITADNEVCLYYYSSGNPSTPITISGILTDTGTTKIDLMGTSANWNGKAVLQKGSGYTGDCKLSGSSWGTLCKAQRPILKLPLRDITWM